MGMIRFISGKRFLFVAVFLLSAGAAAGQTAGWVTKVSMPFGRIFPFAGAIDGILYVAGGLGSSGDTPTLQAYNPATDSWSVLTSMPGGRYQGAAGVISGKLYVAGGWTTFPGLPNSNLFVYNPGTNTWESKASMPTLSGCGVGGVINGKFYVITPCNGFSGYRVFFHVYDPATNAWTPLPNSPNAHAGSAAGVIGDKFYVAGGIDTNGRVHRFLDVYNPVTNTWTAGASMPVARVNMTGVVLNDKLYAIGGSDSTFVFLTSNTVLVYDPATDTWSSGENMTANRVAMAADAINGVIYAAGGSSNVGAVTTTEAFAPDAAVVLRGDLNEDGELNVLDVILLVRVLIGKTPAPQTGSSAFMTVDVDENNTLDISDVVLLINRILRLGARPVAIGNADPALIRLDAAYTGESGLPVIPVFVRNPAPVVGLMISLSFDASRIEIGRPELTGRAGGMSMDYHIQDGLLRVALFGLDGRGVSAGEGTVLLIPVNRIPDDGQTGEVTLTYAALADRQAQPVRVTIDATPVKPSAVPARFALHSATPNPFNPNTTITFDVPEQTHILLVVYNLIGQEVARLVDAVKPPGRYTVIWDGRDARRHAVSSGVYLYRLTTDAGFCATKRVTLLK